MILYFFWELAVTAICLAALARVESAAWKLGLVLAANITLSALSATAVSFLQWNQPEAYLALAACFLVVPAVWRTPWSAPGPSASLSATAIWFALGVLMVLSIRPIEEGDSLYNLHYIMGWVQNRTTPYQFAYNYVPFWELSFVPGIVLVHGDSFFWFQSLKPVLLLGVLLLLIARELELPERLAVWTVPALLLFPYLWLGPSGASTIKNDMIHAAGYAMAALAAVRAASGRREVVDVALVAFACAFASVKFSGPVVMIAGGAVLAAISARWIAHNLRTSAIVLGVVMSFWFLTAGHYFLRNYLLYANPVFPYSINLGPIHFPGRADLSGTSILYSLHDPRLWRYWFLPDRGLSPAGLLFPLILPAIVVGSAIVAAMALWRRKMTPAATLALFQIVSWFIYFRSTYSASGWPGDMKFIVNDLNSIRYVEGPLLVGELTLVWTMWRARVPQWVITAAVALQAGSCFWLLLRWAPDKPWGLAVATGVALAVFRAVMRPRMVLPASAALAAASLAFGTYLVERRRPLWLPALQPLLQPLYKAPAQDVYYLIDDEFTPQTCWHFPFLGHRLQHVADSGSLETLMTRTAPPRYVA
ncbi:MAG: hypothetical protein ABIZ80_03430, partial [Bryobacteraceae bacterium]